MKNLSIIVAVLVLVGCGKGSGIITDAPKTLSREESENDANEVALNRDEEEVLKYLLENKNHDHVSVGYEVAKMLKRNVKNVDALLSLVELVRAQNEQMEVDRKILIEIKKI